MRDLAGGSLGLSVHPPLRRGQAGLADLLPGPPGQGQGPTPSTLSRIDLSQIPEGKGHE